MLPTVRGWKKEDDRGREGERRGGREMGRGDGREERGRGVGGNSHL